MKQNKKNQSPTDWIVTFANAVTIAAVICLIGMGIGLGLILYHFVFSKL